LFSVIARLDRAIQKEQLDYPVKPDNDSHWNRVHKNDLADAEDDICTDIRR
jgi:hypothetical protein